MLEATRKGMWKATTEQIKKLADLHTDLAKEFGVEASQFSSENKKLQDYISQKASAEKAQAYQKQLSLAKKSSAEISQDKDSKVLKKEESSTATEQQKVSFGSLWIILAVGIAFVGLILFIRKRRK